MIISEQKVETLIFLIFLCYHGSLLSGRVCPGPDVQSFPSGHKTLGVIVRRVHQCLYVVSPSLFGWRGPDPQCPLLSQSPSRLGSELGTIPNS